ncbi:hypothetical protein DQ04_09121020 [Trypanosoma grayi]|uniref:hypothetical protein n=1 Tax=Trypanosoma grayi TaxID=71804 RepID=UPI0004F481FD|nr:hypothetical protein DQ04_09121020 [Trypanosoma grayi]KEG07678.1 hypothetical protein DQ04_09121020 [Trypanosoma grayi]
MLRPRFVAASIRRNGSHCANGTLARGVFHAATSSTARINGVRRSLALFSLPLSRTARGFGHLVREVDTHGFRGDIHVLRHKNAAATQRYVAEALASPQNMIFCGAYHTGKMTILKAIGEACETQQKKVAYVSADAQRACRFEGLLLYHFLGLRYMGREELPSRDQLDGTLERHARLCEATYAGCVPSLRTVDVLILDAVHQIAPTIILSMDTVCRQLRGRPNEAFGGLRVFAAADFWRLSVHPGSDTGGYIYQLDNWDELFPRQRLLEKIHGQARRLTALVNKAYCGLLTSQDIEELEVRSTKGRPTAQEDADDEDGENADDVDVGAADTTAASSLKPDNGSGRHSSSGRSTSLPPQDLISNVETIVKFTSRFPKQPAIRVLPPRFRTLKRTEIGNYVVNMMLQSSLPQSFCLVDSLNLDVGASVHLLLDAPASFGVPAGTVGEVLQVKEHVLVVHFPSVHRTVDVPRMRVSVYHSFYPEVRYELQQFPLFPRHCISPMNITGYKHTYNVHIDCSRLADTNDLGNILARMRSFDDFSMHRTQSFVRLDGMVHEPTRIYYQRITNRPISTAAEQWCRNCKSYVPTAEFYTHWDKCIRHVRWCSECNTRIPLERLIPHQEKHQIVLCMDCGKAVEWRQWEGHRLTCSAMMREVSPENEFLPLRTRQLALEMGLDKRDLHTMRAFSRGLLPKSRKQCTSGDPH